MTIGWTFQGKETIRYTLPLFGYHLQRFGQWKEIGRAATRTRLVEGVFIPGRIQARGRKEKEYKNGDPQKRGLELKILKVTIREEKACNHVNVKCFNVLVNL